MQTPMPADLAYLALALAANGQTQEAISEWQSITDKLPKGVNSGFLRLFELLKIQI